MAIINTTEANLGTAKSNVGDGTRITASELRSTLGILATFVNHTHSITDTYATNCECNCNCRCNCFGNGCNLN
jgi:hypothetical protein